MTKYLKFRNFMKQSPSLEADSRSSVRHLL
jgi:hypothetical protein